MNLKKNKTDELTGLFDNLNIDNKAANEIRHDIETGDDLFRQQSESNCPAELIDRIMRDIQNRPQRLSWPMRLQRIAAVLILGFVLVGLFELIHQPVKNGSLQNQTILLADEFDVLETALDLEQDELDVAFDDPAVADILSLWDDADWDIQQIFGKEFSDETDTHTSRRGFNDWIG